MKTARLIALGIALALVFVAGNAAAERVWTKTSASLRAEPDRQSRRVARVQANRELDVVRKQGRWLKVKSGAKSGWIHRSKVRNQRAGVAAAPASQAPKSASAARAADSTPPAAPAGQADTSPAADAPAAAAGTPNRQKPSKSAKPAQRKCRKDAIWCRRDRKGDAMRVLVTATRVQAYKEPGADEDLAFWVTKDQELVVLGRHRPNWLLVQSLEGKLGWLPKTVVRPKGNLVNHKWDQPVDVAPRSVDELAQETPEQITAAPARTETAPATVETPSGNTDTAPAGTENPNSVALSTGTSSAGTDIGQPVVMAEPSRPAGPLPISLDVNAGLGAALISRSFAAQDMEQANYDVASLGALAGIAGDIKYRLLQRWQLGFDISFSAVSGLPGGLTYDTTGEENDVAGLNYILHRTEAHLKFGYQEQFRAFLRAGGVFEMFYINDLTNDARLPRERLVSPSLGVELGVGDLVEGLNLGLRANLALFGASFAQTPGLEDGQMDGLLALAGQLDASYQVRERLTIHGTYRYDLANPQWAGDSIRMDGVNGASRTDQTHRVLVGVGVNY